MVVGEAERSGGFVVEMIEMVSGLNRSVSSHFGRRGLSFSGSRVGSHYKAWMSRYFQVLVLSCSLISFVLAIACGYLYAYPSLNLIIHDSESLETAEPVDEKCDLFDGHWVPDSSYPLYNASECPFAERGFNCLANGRKDRDYLKWRWKPKNCELPKFDVQRILKWLRGKRVVFVGDSMSRTQWESMICMLMTGVEDKRGVYEINGNKITKQIRFLGVYFTSYNFTVEFFRSVFLVQQGWASRHGPKRVKSTIKLDKLDDISKEWSDSDILIFNSGHWWSPGKLFDAQGLLFPSRWGSQAWHANHNCFQNSIKHLGILG
ncbi:hypothetical protein Sjap_021884 [Stephania japonica]|uniref:Trichome birefringence-like N-terminal domain-containing protein n=1 Tax=Stephania japonica TaxID=461633 RepID=A0AAP0HT79_9MAGN